VNKTREYPDVEETVYEPDPAFEEARQNFDPADDGRDNALPLTFFRDLASAATLKPWLLKNVIARGETSSWIAPPFGGKSSLLTDLSIHKAGDMDWRGYRTKGGTCGVVYFALERADLVKRRLLAHKLRDGLPELPIAVSGRIIDLMSVTCVDVIVDTIRRAEQDFGLGAGLAIIDTYSKGIAGGGGDENKAKDQNIVAANLRRVIERAHIHIAAVGHTGKDPSRGERGSNAHLADVDLQIEIRGDKTKTAMITQANDQPVGVLTGFRLEPFVFSPDEDGDPIQTFIISREILTASDQARQGMSDRQKLALDALHETILSCGQDAPPEYHLPHGSKVAAADQWKEELFRRSVLDRDAKNPRARFHELRNALAARNLIGTRDDQVWTARR
jgi:hypothetical protein